MMASAVVTTEMITLLPSARMKSSFWKIDL